MTSIKLLTVKSVPENVREVTRGNWLITPVSASAQAGGTVFVPVDEIEMGAFYTFECEENGCLYRWIDCEAREINDGGFVVFLLPPADMVVAA